jgi:hypothetical protein
MAVAVACGFMTDFGLRSETLWGKLLWIIPAWLFLSVFMALWPRRERRQHGGLIPSRQSGLEAFAPGVFGFITYVLAVLVFWKLKL